MLLCLGDAIPMIKKHARPVKNNKGLSLTEIIVVVIILGMFATLGIPNFVMSVERSRAGEGVQILEALLAGQRIFEYEHGNYADGSTSGQLLADLDVEIPATLQHFDTVAIDDPADPINNPIATVDRINGDYRLGINEAGVIICTDLSGSVCSHLKF